jgi:hypothetical protein
MRFAPKDIVMLKENSDTRSFEGDVVFDFIAFSGGGDASLLFKY